MTTSATDALREELLALLTPHGQQHVLAFWDELAPAERAALAAEVRELDLPLLTRLAQKQEAATDWAALARRAEPPPAFRLGADNRFTASEARARGEAALRAGEVGTVLVAGGQGTRLGFDAPKGMFAIGPVSKASLFQILLEKLLAVGRRYKVQPPLYLMTSPATQSQTVEYLAEHKRFGLAAQEVQTFMQGTMPAVDAATGKLLLSAKGKLALSPDGHGGMLAAMHRQGLLEDCRQRGIRMLFYFQIDNPLVAMCDPEFIGYHLLSESQMSTQVVAKRAPLERVGNFVTIDGQARIIEYSDLPDDVAEQRAADGSLKLWAGNIAVHVLDVDFLTQVVSDADSLPFHRAKKRVPHVAERGHVVQPEQPNATKFERFIFDLLPLARNPIAVEVDEARTFAPIKNACGEPKDTPDTCQAQMIRLHREWLTSAGVNVAAETPVEISPLFALDADEVKSKRAELAPITEPTYLR